MNQENLRQKLEATTPTPKQILDRINYEATKLQLLEELAMGRITREEYKDALGAMEAMRV